jgi:hypothetical protein
MLTQQNKDKFNPLMLAIKRASENKSDPINVVKLMLETPSGKAQLEQADL